MKSLCTDDSQRTHLLKLVNLVESKVLSGTDAWTAFAVPAETKTFKKKGEVPRTFQFSGEEVCTYQQLRRMVTQHLYKRNSGCCSYCRRPVGHYGWAWHIEHVFPKSQFPAHTFKLANLTVGCVHCNQWKGARVDRLIQRNRNFPIINPVVTNFRYSDHLRYLQVSTESLSFARYSTHSTEGRETYEKLSFDELERAHAIDGLNGTMAALHERINRAMGVGLSDDEGKEFLQLLSTLKSAMYRRS